MFDIEFELIVEMKKVGFRFFFNITIVITSFLSVLEIADIA